jgi:hypothetical protein
MSRQPKPIAQIENPTSPEPPMSEHKTLWWDSSPEGNLQKRIWQFRSRVRQIREERARHIHLRNLHADYVNHSNAVARLDAELEQIESRLSDLGESI